MPAVVSRPLAATAGLVLGILLVGGCSTDQVDAPRLDGLLVLAGDTGGANLRMWRGDDPVGGGEPLAVPDGTKWVAAGRADVLVVSLADGTLRISQPIRTGEEPTWTQPDAALDSGDQAAGPVYFPTWDPGGGHLAVLAGDLDVDPRLTLVDPSAGSAVEIDLGQPVAAAPPAWVDADRVAVVTGPDDAPTSILVDAKTGKVSPGRPGARLVATSADGRTVAVAQSGAKPIVIRSTKAWLTGGGATVAVIDPPEDAVAATSMALDATGGRLAVAWLEAGGTIRITCYEAAREWQPIVGPPAEGAAGAVIAWFR